MTPRELQNAMGGLDMLPAELAARLGVTRKTVYRWLWGTTPICERTRMALRLMEIDPSERDRPNKEQDDG